MKTNPSDPAAGALAASPAGETRLGSAQVTVNLPAPSAERLSAATARGKHLYLAVDGLQVLHPGAVYQVYLDLPAGSAPDPQGPYFVGNLSLYTDPGRTAEIRRTYDVTEQVKALRQRGEWKGPVRVTFVQERLGGEPSPPQPRPSSASPRSPSSTAEQPRGKGDAPRSEHGILSREDARTLQRSSLETIPTADADRYPGGANFTGARGC